MKRNLILLAVGLAFVLGLSSGALALNRPWGWGTEADDHTWGGDQGYGPDAPTESASMSTGILALDILFIKLVHSEPIKVVVQPVTIIRVDPQQGGATESWSGGRSISDAKGN